MLAAFKEYVLPLIMYLLVLTCAVGGWSKAGKPSFILFIVLVSLPSLWYPTHQFPLGKDTLDILFASTFIGVLVAGRLAWPKQGWILATSILFTYFAVWRASSYFSLPDPLTRDNPILVDWKNYALMLAWTFLAYSTTDSERFAKIVSRTMICVLLFMCWREVASFTVGASFSWTNRAEGPLWIVGLNSNHFGAFIAQTGLLALGMWGYEDRGRWKIVCGIAAAMALYPLLYAYSRGAYLAYSAGLMVICSLRYRRAIPFLIVAAIFWQVVLPDTVGERISMTETEDGSLEESAALRITMWNLAQDIFASNPFIGIGFNGFFFASEGMQLRNAHNYFVQIAAEQGVVGLVILAMMMLSGIVVGWKLWRHAAQPRMKGLGLGFLGYSVAMIVANMFGDRFSQLELGAFYFVLLGTCSRILALQNKPLPASENDTLVSSDGYVRHI